MGSLENQLDIIQILNTLPHRYPFILVDRVLEYVTGDSLKALKNVTINEPFFQGHFPTEPVMPGVLIIEGLAQAGALLAYLTEPESVGKKMVYFAGLDKARFRQKVTPGDQLIYEIEIIKTKLSMWTLGGKAFVDGKLAAEAQLMASFR